MSYANVIQNILFSEIAVNEIFLYLQINIDINGR
jgi:hypothetical protein